MLFRSKEKYITTTQGVDLAVGFRDLEALQEAAQLDSYDYMFLDIDTYRALSTFHLSADDMIFLTTTFDIYSLKVGLSILSHFKEKVIVNKILLAKTVTPYHVQYISHVCKDCNITWGNISIFFPYDNGDLTIIFENQREYRMKLNKFSKDFLGSLLDLCVTIEPSLSKEIARFIKTNSKN